MPLIKRTLRNFVKRTEGAVTVDFVVLSAAAAALGVSVGYSFLDNGSMLGQRLDGSITNNWDEMLAEDE